MTKAELDCNCPGCTTNAVVHMAYMLAKEIPDRELFAAVLSFERGEKINLKHVAFETLRNLALIDYAGAVEGGTKEAIFRAAYERVHPQKAEWGILRPAKPKAIDRRPPSIADLMRPPAGFPGFLADAMFADLVSSIQRGRVNIVGGSRSGFNPLPWDAPADGESVKVGPAGPGFVGGKPVGEGGEG